ncbi:uncharacterized protein [Ptychodera flava]|uniref:uncharacterized protein n=1 Tax=Ptychodera flava TaxID=63121 RepID=UPI003969FD0C
MVQFVLFTIMLASLHTTYSNTTMSRKGKVLDALSNAFTDVNGIHMVLQALNQTISERYSESGATGLLRHVHEIREELYSIKSTLAVLADVPSVDVNVLLQQIDDFEGKISGLKIQVYEKMHEWSQCFETIALALDQIESLETQLLDDLQRLTRRGCLRKRNGYPETSFDTWSVLDSLQPPVMVTSTSLHTLQDTLDFTPKYKDTIRLQIPEELVRYVTHVRDVLDHTFCETPEVTTERKKRSVLARLLDIDGSTVSDSFRQSDELQVRNGCSLSQSAVERAICEIVKEDDLDALEEKALRKACKDIQSGKSSVTVPSKKLQQAVADVFDKLGQSVSVGARDEMDGENFFLGLRNDCSVLENFMDRAICEIVKEDDLNALEEKALRKACKDIQSGKSSVTVPSKKLQQAVADVFDKLGQSVSVGTRNEIYEDNLSLGLRGDCSVLENFMDRAICEIVKEDDLNALEEKALRKACKDIQSGKGRVSVPSKKLQQAVADVFDKLGQSVSVGTRNEIYEDNLSLGLRGDCSVLENFMDRAICEIVKEDDLDALEEKALRKACKDIQSGKSRVSVPSKKLQQAIADVFDELGQSVSVGAGGEMDGENFFLGLRGDCSVLETFMDRAICEIVKEDDLDALEEKELRKAAKEIQSGKGRVSVPSKKLQQAVIDVFNKLGQSVSVGIRDIKELLLQKWYEQKSRQRRDVDKWCFTLAAYLENKYKVSNDTLHMINRSLSQVASPPVMDFPVITNSFAGKEMLPQSVSSTIATLSEWLVTLKETLAVDIRFGCNLSDGE